MSSFGGSIHTVSQTRDWIILCDSGNFKADPAEMMGGERSLTIDDEVPVWLIRKEQLDGLASGAPVTPVCLTMSPPAGHYYARWDDTDGISVVWEGMDRMDLGFYLRPDDLDVNGNPVDPAAVGLYNMAMGPETITEVVFDPDSGKVLEQGLFKQDWTFNLQLSAMDWSTEGMSAPTLHHVTYQGCRPGNVSQRAARLYEDRIDLDLLREETPGALCSFERGSMELKARWDYPDTADHITSPAFAPRGAVGGQLRRRSARRPRRLRGATRLQRQRVPRRSVRRGQGVGRAGRHARGHEQGVHPCRAALGVDAGRSRARRRRAPAVLRRAQRRTHGLGSRGAPPGDPRGRRGVRRARVIRQWGRAARDGSGFGGGIAPR